MSGSVGAPGGNQNRKPADWPARAYSLMRTGTMYTVQQVQELLRGGPWSSRSLPECARLSRLLMARPALIETVKETTSVQIRNHKYRFQVQFKKREARP